MNASDLITMCTPHGIDLRHIAGASSNTDGVARKRRPNAEERRWQMDVTESVLGTQTRTYKRPDWSHAELGQALAGVPRMPELAAYYSLCGYLRGFAELHRGMQVKLLQRIDREQREHGITWPMTIEYLDGPGIPYDYVPKLPLLVLIYEANRQAFVSAPGLPTALLNVSNAVWQRQLRMRYEWLEAEYQRWIAVALGMIARWIRDDGETPDAA